MNRQNNPDYAPNTSRKIHDPKTKQKKNFLISNTDRVDNAEAFYLPAVGLGPRGVRSAEFGLRPSISTCCDC
jgi:hypothetical protein